MGVTLIHNPSPIVTLPQVAPHESAPALKTTRRGRMLVLLLIVGASMLPFLPSLRYGFVYDDEMQIIRNQTIQKGGFFRSYFTTPVAGFYDSTQARPYYRPLFMLWLRLNYLAFGKRPFGWHLTTLAAHIIVTLLVFALLGRHLTNPRAAVAGAIVFGLHPVHIESVAWISGVTDPLVSVGMLASLLLWWKAQERPSIRLRSASLLCYAIALLTKEIAVVLPAFIFVYAVTAAKDQPEGLSKKITLLGRALLSALPYMSMAALFLIARHYVVRGLYTGTPWISAREAVLTAPSLAIFYLRHLLWPASLSLFYDFPIVVSAESIHFWLPLILLAGLSLLAVLWKQRDAIGFVLFAWIWLPLLPVLNITFFSVDDFAHDRYLYLPVTGLSLAIALVLKHLMQKAPEEWGNVAAIAVAALVVAPLGILTVTQSRSWRDNFALYSDAVNHSPKNAVALNNLGCVYGDSKHFEEAGDLFRRALTRLPTYWNANFNYGNLNYQTNHYQLAESFFLRAIRIAPRDPNQYFLLGMTYFKENRLEEAASMLRQAIARKPDGLAYHLALGLVLKQQGDPKAAKEEFLKELTYYPGNATAREELSALNRDVTSSPPSTH